MAVRLRNKTEPQQTLSLTHQAWYSLLDLAEAYGWRPVGTLLPGEWDWLELELNGFAPFGLPVNGNGMHDDEGADESRLVVIEDALSLAEALDQAFMDYEPNRVPTTFYLFEPEEIVLRNRPTVGTINTTVEFCRQGAFWIEIYRDLS